MPENKPSIYDIEFKDIYEIEFLDLEAPEASPVLEVDEVPQPELNEQISPNVITQVAVADVIVIDPITDHGSTDVVQPEASENKVEDIIVSAELQDRVSAEIEKVLASSQKAFISLGEIILKITGRARLSKTLAKQYKQAIKQDGRLEYFKDGSYLIIERSQKALDAYNEGRDPLVDEETIQMLLNTIMDVVFTDDEGFIRHKGLLGAINSRGVHLNSREMHEFFARFNSKSGVIPLPNGDYRLDVSKNQRRKSVNRDYDTLRETGPKPVGIIAKDGKSLTTKQANKAMNEINRSPEVKDAADRAKRKANTRTHGRNYRKRSGKKSQGKAHGKKVNFETLLAQMNSTQGRN